LQGPLGGPDDDRPVALGGEAAQRGVVHLDDPPRLRQHPLALVREAHVPPVAFEELAFEATFEEPDVLAQRGMADVAYGGRLAEPAALGDRDQRAQVFEVERVGHVSIRALPGNDRESLLTHRRAGCEGGWVTTRVISTSTVAGVWDEPSGLAARGTAVVLTGRGETAASYQRVGRRLAADAYRVRVVEVDLDDLATTRKQVRALLADDSLPAPKVLIGSDTGATYAARLAGELDEVDGVVLAGLALPGSTQVTDWDDELDVRTACPTHRAVLSGDEGFARGALARPVPAGWTVTASATPTVVLHGSADRVSPPAAAFAPFRDAPNAWLRTVVGGRHDVLNDVSHRSVAATVILFLESLKLGRELPAIVTEVQT
jgi:alpha-beta hydrolase superfamily lysophospholipase